MPWKYTSLGRLDRYCRNRRAWSWSTLRGGCRFGPGHAGPCKPSTARHGRPAW